MPDLMHTLQGQDLQFLKMVAGLWGVELNAPDVRTALPQLVTALSDHALVQEVSTALAEDARKALGALLEHEGRLVWAQFSRLFGDVRTKGAAWRDRERPDLHPASPAEMLWYRALIGRAFLSGPGELQEYAYIPDDFLIPLGPLYQPGERVFGRPASRAEAACLIPVNDAVLDHACTLLAALRTGMPFETLPADGWHIPPETLCDLLRAAGLLDGQDLPLPEPVRAFLEAPRARALAQLAGAWLHSDRFNDLRHVPGLSFEGDWENEPLLARQNLMELLSHVPQDRWWNLASFVSTVREAHPDFQRPNGDYDSWFIRQGNDGPFLRSFEVWDKVDGALVRYVLTGPLHWLGLFDLAAPANDAPPAAFRASAWAEALWHGQPPESLAEESASLTVHTGGRIDVPRLVPRAARYQLARFCSWLPPRPEGYAYQITPESLERAGRQGLKIVHLTSLLRKHAAGQLPPPLLQALERWEQHGVQARLENVILLRVHSAELLNAIRQSRAARYLGSDLNPTTAVVKPGQHERLLKALAELGYLAEARLEGAQK